MLAGHDWHPEGRDDLVIRKSGDAWLLYDPTRDSRHPLDSTAALVWSFCTGENRVDVIRAKVLGAQEPGDSAEDVQEILDGFQAAGFFVED